MNLKDIIDKNSEQTVTNLYGEEIIISRERKIYADIYSKYEIVARESTAIFQRLYSEHYDILKKVEMVRDGVVSDFHASIKMVIDEIRADLTSIGIYDYTNESVMKKAEGEGFFDDFKEVYTNICESINRIDNELVGEKEYR